LVQKFLLMLSLFITFRISISAIVLSWLFVQFISFIVSEVIMYRSGIASINKYVRSLEIMAGCMPLVLYHFFIRFFISNHIVTLVIEIVSSPLIFLSTLKLLDLPIYRLFVALFKQRLPRLCQRIL
jgi:hypothetical protein